MNLFNNIIESFSEKTDQKKNTAFKINDYIPHMFLIIILIICVIVGLIYIEQITELLGLSSDVNYGHITDKYGDNTSYNANRN